MKKTILLMILVLSIGALIFSSCEETEEESNTAPVAKFEADKTTITEGESIQFTDQSTNEPTSWSWDFGDGNTSTEENPSHTYTSVGTYTVELTVTNDYGSDTKTKTDYITVVTSPTANFEADQTTITEGDTVNFTDQSANNPTSWSWDFGDGESSSDENPSHTYSSAGTYTVELTVENDYGSDTKTKTDYITVESNITACDWNNDTLFTDSRDGQEYKQTKIGDQCWMAENLNYDQNSYGNDWCYDNNSSNCDTYGRLYDWAAVMQGASGSSSNPSGVQGVCPDGWHVPSDDEWEQLAEYISNDNGGYSQDGDDWNNVGGHLKATSGWGSGNNGTDDYGFSGLPGGNRNTAGSFNYIGNYDFWWSATENGTDYAWYRYLGYDEEIFRRNDSNKDYGLSVRCLRD